MEPKVIISIPLKDGTFTTSIPVEEFKRIMLAASVAFQRQEAPQEVDTKSHQRVIDIRHHLRANDSF